MSCENDDFYYGSLSFRNKKKKNKLCRAFPFASWVIEVTSYRKISNSGERKEYAILWGKTMCNFPIGMICLNPDISSQQIVLLSKYVRSKVMRNLQNERISNILLNFYNIFTLVFTASLTNIARPKYIMTAWKIIALVFIVCTYTC